jgi:signal transduction histidine kinase
MDAVSGFATLVWPPTGLALAALFLFGYRLWPGVALGAFVVNAWTGAPVAVALGIALGNTLEAVAGVWILRRLRVVATLDRLRDVLSLIGPAALGSTLVSASIGVTSLYVGGIVPIERTPETWWAWWVGDSLGDLVVAPLILVWAGSPRFLPARRRVAEAIFLALATLAIGFFVFFGGTLANPSPVRQAYLIFPVLIWAALRLGVRGATSVTFAFSAIAIWGTALGVGPFVHARLADSLLFLQSFMAAAAGTGLVLGAAAAERSEALHRRESFLAVVSHDLKNPLTVLRLAANSLMRELEKGWPSERGKHVRTPLNGILRSTDRMEALVLDLVDLAAVESGRLSLRFDRHELTALVREAVEDVRPLARQKSQSVDVVLPPEPVEVTCDRERLLQVFSNLITNAIKFSPETASISVSAAPSDGELLLSVADSGPGVAGDELRHVFDPFWRGKTGERGAGLGLAIARGIIQSHGGRIWVESKIGGGTTFSFTLPGSTAETGDAGRGMLES